jgi:peroxiredoxin
MIALFDSGVDSVRLSGVLETAVNTGDTIPLFSLPDPRGDTVSIANLLDDGPVVITWYRGNW